MTRQPRNPSRLADLIRDGSKQKPSGRPPPVEKEFHMRIARDGTWYHEGRPIPRIELVKLFATVLKRDAEGGYWLETPVERGRIAVEDAPFTAVALRTEGTGSGRRLHFRTNLDEEVTAGPEHPIRVETDPETREPAPYIMVRGGLEALILRPVFYEMADMAEPREQGDGTELGLWSDGAYFTLGRGA